MLAALDHMQSLSTLSRSAEEIATGADAAALLMRVHYGFFMANPHFWYEPTLVQAPLSVRPRVLPKATLRTREEALSRKARKFLSPDALIRSNEIRV